MFSPPLDENVDLDTRVLWSKTVGAEGDVNVVCRVVRSLLVQVCIASTPGLDGRRASMKDILGEKLVAMINEVETDASAGDVSD